MTEKKIKQEVIDELMKEYPLSSAFSAHLMTAFFNAVNGAWKSSWPRVLAALAP
jgi:hypothetical protein